jgi:enoyl-[acyl-carrier-protein] reductase (NADH)
MNKEADTNPMGRAGTIEEVCSTIIHLTSQHSRKLTG